MEIIYSLGEIESIAKKILLLAKNYSIISFSGEMGAGKTTLINFICQQLGVDETVNSPTYAIIQEYKTKTGKAIYHMDLYRIKNNQEAIEAGVEDCLQSGSLCLVEWPENATLLFDQQTVSIFLETISETIRKLVIQLPQ